MQHILCDPTSLIRSATCRHLNCKQRTRGSRSLSIGVVGFAQDVQINPQKVAMSARKQKNNPNFRYYDSLSFCHWTRPHVIPYFGEKSRSVQAADYSKDFEIHVCCVVFATVMQHEASNKVIHICSYPDCWQISETYQSRQKQKLVKVTKMMSWDAIYRPATDISGKNTFPF